MNNSDIQLISKVSSHLRLVDIALVESRFDRPIDFPSTPEVNFALMTKKVVTYQFEKSSDLGELLMAKVDLGVRLCNGDAVEDVEPQTFVEVEAKFLVMYALSTRIDEEKAYKLFAEHNCVHNVWPFWRQHVFDIVQRGRLPMIEIPLMAGIPKEPTAIEATLSSASD